MAARHHRIGIAFALALALALSARADDPVTTPPHAIELVASRFKFTPAVIEVTQGEHVQLNVHSSDGTHGLSIKDFQVKTKVPKTGETVTVEFVADKAGTFPFKCSEYCGGGHSRMKGELVVHPKGQ
jgi:cytochrome c oxidase subunit 2